MPDALPYQRSLPTCFARGMVQSLPFLVVLVPFALLFGVLSRATGLDLAATMGMSILVLAGASQLTMLQLFQQEASAIIVILSALAVNLRMAMYSASLAQWLGRAGPWQRMAIAFTLIDQNYVISVREYEIHPKLTLKQRIAFYGGTMLVLIPPWPFVTYLGATIGATLPTDQLGMDIVVPIMFMAMVAPTFRSAPHLLAAVVSIILALAFNWLPPGLGLMVAAPSAMVAAAMLEKHLHRRRALRNAPEAAP